MKHLALMALGMLAVSPAQAAGFDCGKASLPIEKAICTDQALSQADDEINDAYTFLLAQCREVAAHADLRGTQRLWLAGVRKDYGEGSPEALDRLKAAYRARNDALAGLLAACNPDRGPVRATVTMVQDTVNGYTVPFVQANPPESGWRINKVLFAGYDGSPPMEIGGLKTFFAKHKPSDQASGLGAWDLVSNKGNLLVLHVSGSTCEPEAPRCSPYDMQYAFDIRTGRVVQPGDLYTLQGGNALAQSLGEKLRGLAKSRLAAVSKADAEAFGEQYSACMTRWETMPVGTWPVFTADGRAQFMLGNCSTYDEYGPAPDEPEGTALDNLTLTAALPELRPYLNAYGKSLLLGEGDVRAPGAEAAAGLQKGRRPGGAQERP